MPGPLKKALPEVRRGVGDREKTLLQGAMMKVRPAQLPAFDTSSGRINRMADAELRSALAEKQERQGQMLGMERLRGTQEARAIDPILGQRQQNAQTGAELSAREAELRKLAMRPKVDVAKLEGAKNDAPTRSPWEAFKARR